MSTKAILDNFGSAAQILVSASEPLRKDMETRVSAQISNVMRLRHLLTSKQEQTLNRILSPIVIRGSDEVGDVKLSMTHAPCNVLTEIANQHLKHSRKGSYLEVGPNLSRLGETQPEHFCTVRSAHDDFRINNKLNGLYEDPNDSFCTNGFLSCDYQCETILMSNVYDISPTDFVKGMRKHGAKTARIAMLLPQKLALNVDFELPEYGIQIKYEGENVIMHFAGWEAGYVHSVKAWNEWINPQKHMSAMGAFVEVEYQAGILSFLKVALVENPGVQVGKSSNLSLNNSMRKVYKWNVQPELLIASLSWASNEKMLNDVKENMDYFVIPEKLYEQIVDFGISKDDRSFTRNNMAQYMRALKNKIVLGNKVIIEGYSIDSDEFTYIVTNIYIQLCIQRRIQTKNIGDFINMLQSGEMTYFQSFITKLKNYILPRGLNFLVGKEDTLVAKMNYIATHTKVDFEEIKLYPTSNFNEYNLNKIKSNWHIHVTDGECVAKAVSRVLHSDESNHQGYSNELSEVPQEIVEYIQDYDGHAVVNANNRDFCQHGHWRGARFEVGYYKIHAPQTYMDQQPNDIDIWNLFASFKGFMNVNWNGAKEIPKTCTECFAGKKIAINAKNLSDLDSLDYTQTIVVFVEDHTAFIQTSFRNPLVISLLNSRKISNGNKTLYLYQLDMIEKFKRGYLNLNYKGYEKFLPFLIGGLLSATQEKVVYEIVEIPRFISYDVFSDFSFGESFVRDFSEESVTLVKEAANLNLVKFGVITLASYIGLKYIHNKARANLDSLKFGKKLKLCSIENAVETVGEELKEKEQEPIREESELTTEPFYEEKVLNTIIEHEALSTYIHLESNCNTTPDGFNTGMHQYAYEFFLFHNMPLPSNFETMSTRDLRFLLSGTESEEWRVFRVEVLYELYLHKMKPRKEEFIKYQNIYPLFGSEEEGEAEIIQEILLSVKLLFMKEGAQKVAQPTFLSCLERVLGVEIEDNGDRLLDEGEIQKIANEYNCQIIFEDQIFGEGRVVFVVQEEGYFAAYHPYINQFKGVEEECECQKDLGCYDTNCENFYAPTLFRQSTESVILIEDPECEQKETKLKGNPLTVIKGDLLKGLSKDQMLVHQVNTTGGHNAGIALALDNKYKLSTEFKIGKVVIDERDGKICNLAGQRKPGKSNTEPRANWFKSGLEDLADKLTKQTKEIFFPTLIGCELAGGDPKEYHKLITDFSDRVEQKVYLVDLDRGKSIMNKQEREKLDFSKIYETKAFHEDGSKKCAYNLVTLIKKNPEKKLFVVLGCVEGIGLYEICKLHPELEFHFYDTREYNMPELSNVKFIKKEIKRNGKGYNLPYDFETPIYADLSTCSREEIDESKIFEELELNLIALNYRNSIAKGRLPLVRFKIPFVKIIPQLYSKNGIEVLFQRGEEEFELNQEFINSKSHINKLKSLRDCHSCNAILQEDSIYHKYFLSLHVFEEINLSLHRVLVEDEYAGNHVIQSQDLYLLIEEIKNNEFKKFAIPLAREYKFRKQAINLLTKINKGNHFLSHSNCPGCFKEAGIQKGEVVLPPPSQVPVTFDDEQLEYMIEEKIKTLDTDKIIYKESHGKAVEAIRKNKYLPGTYHVYMSRGGAGCGKSTNIRQNFPPTKGTVVLSPTNRLAKEFKEKGYTAVTMAKFYTMTGKVCIIDEIYLNHPLELIHAIHNFEKVFVIGDPYQNKSGNATTQIKWQIHQLLDHSNASVLNTSFSVPVDCATMLRKNFFYPYSTCSKVEESVTFSDTVSTDPYLCFTALVRDNAARSTAFTAPQAQGMRVDKISLVVEGSASMLISSLPAQAIVNFTRHKKELEVSGITPARLRNLGLYQKEHNHRCSKTNAVKGNFHDGKRFMREGYGFESSKSNIKIQREEPRETIFDCKEKTAILGIPDQIRTNIEAFNIPIYDVNLPIEHNLDFILQDKQTEKSFSPNRTFDSLAAVEETLEKISPALDYDSELYHTLNNNLPQPYGKATLNSLEEIMMDRTREITRFEGLALRGRPYMAGCKNQTVHTMLERSLGDGFGLGREEGENLSTTLFNGVMRCFDSIKKVTLDDLVSAAGEYFETLQPRQTQKHLDTFEVTEYNKSQKIQWFHKVQTKASSKPFSILEWKENATKAGQGVSPQVKGVNHITAPIIRALEKNIEASFNEKIFFTFGKKPFEVKSKIEEFLSKNRSNFYESDFSSYDTWHDWVVDSFMNKVFKTFGVDEATHAISQQLNETWEAVNREIKVEMKGHLQSGRAATLFQNSLLTVALTMSFVELENLHFLAVCGDDCLLSADKFTAKFPVYMQSKIKSSTPLVGQLVGYFVGNIVTMDVVRAVIKTGNRNFAAKDSPKKDREGVPYYRRRFTKEQYYKALHKSKNISEIKVAEYQIAIKDWLSVVNGDQELIFASKLNACHYGIGEGEVDNLFSFLFWFSEASFEDISSKMRNYQAIPIIPNLEGY